MLKNDEITKDAFQLIIKEFYNRKNIHINKFIEYLQRRNFESCLNVKKILSSKDSVNGHL